VSNTRDFRDGADPVVRRAIDELQRLPAVADDAVANVVSAAAAARLLPPADEPVFPAPQRGWGRIALAGGLVAAAAFAGFIIRGTVTAPPGSPARVATTTAIAPVAYSTESAVVPIIEQFVFKAPTARRVAVIGDFNRWDPSVAPMARSSDGELWSRSIPIMPGRHTYAFMVDDSILVLDPRAPKTRDPDLGAEGSVRIVGRP
jgi:hypothetical protein